MKGSITAAVLGGLILVVSMGIPLWARADADETQLETVRADIDKGAAGQESRIQTLARQFNVDPGVVQDLRSKKQGWGEVTIELAMAQHLNRTDAQTYPTMADALKKIDTLRADKMGWGEIANQLGFKLGPVVSAAMHTRNELRREAQPASAPKVQKTESIGRPETAGRPDGAGRPEGVGRPERSQRPERAAHVR